MNYKKILSLLLAASMAVSMPINVFATQPVIETENQTKVEPYIADGEAPVLTGIEIDKTSVSAGDSVTTCRKGGAFQYLYLSYRKLPLHPQSGNLDETLQRAGYHTG